MTVPGPRSSRPIRVLQAVGRMNRGGVETWLMHVLRHVDRERFPMDFLVHTTEPGAYDDEIRALGSGIVFCPGASRPWVYGRNLTKILGTRGPYEVVDAHLFLFNGLVLKAAHRAGVPGRIGHIYPHTDIRRTAFLRAFYRRVMIRRIARHASCILSESETSLAAFRAAGEFGRLPAKVVYCGIDLGPFERQVDRAAVRRSLSLPPDKPLIVYVARFVPHKNHEQVLRVADLLNRDGDRVHFALAGSHGPLLERFREAARRRTDLTVLAGLPDVSGLLLAADAFFFPSLEEGFGIAAVEAAAAGLPVIASDLPAIREACAPGHRRLMFPPNDDDAARRRIASVLENPELRSRLSAEGREWVRRFSIEESVARLTTAYESCARRP